MTTPIDPHRTIWAAYRCGAGDTAEEIGDAIGADPKRIAYTLKLNNINFSAKPFGARTIPITLTKEQYMTIGRAARVRSLYGEGRHAILLEMLLRTLAKDTSLLDAVLDDGYTTPTKGD